MPSHSSFWPPNRYITLVNCFFRFNFRFYSIIEWFWYQIWFGMAREYSRICWKPLFCCGGTPQGLFSGQKQHFLKFWTLSFFKKVSFRQKLDFWVTNLERCLIKVVHMDRADHLGFRKKVSFDCKFPSNSWFLEKTNFSRSLGKWINFMGVVFPSNPFSGPLPRTFFDPLKNWTIF